MTLQQWQLPEVLTQFAADGDFDFVHEMIDLFLADADLKIQAIAAAIAESELERMRDLSHSLKGSARQMGLMRLGDQAQTLEHSSGHADIERFQAVACELRQLWREAEGEMTVVKNSLQSHSR